MDNESILNNKMDGYFTDDNSCEFYGADTSWQRALFLVAALVFTAVLFFGWFAFVPADSGGDSALSIVGPQITSAE